MLTALEAGVKGGKWYSLIDKVSSLRSLRSAFAKVKRNRGKAGVDRVTIRQFEAHLESNLESLVESLQGGTYRPQAIRRVWISKEGSREKRPLGIPTVRDRVVQLLKRGYRVVVDADLRSYYDTIPRPPLLKRVGSKVADTKVLDLLEAFLGQEVMESAKHWTPDRGTPQGAVISPLLSNIYLDPLDHLMAQRGYEMVRYADDFVILCRSQLEAQEALAEVTEWVAAAGLQLHPDKTRIVDASLPGGFDFLGYHFEQGRRWPSAKSRRKFKDKIRDLTKRNNGHSLQRIISELTPIQRGWFEYFKHCHWMTFEALDGWIRMRIRSILRRRQGRKGRGEGWDNHRWPNAFFAELGLFSFAAAYAQIRQPSPR
jgi:RNA-directed DNA polymerase